MSTPPGWYPDPESRSEQRYWDGERWTEHRAPLAGVPAATPAAPMPAPGAPPSPGPAPTPGGPAYPTAPQGAPAHGTAPGAVAAAPKKSRKGLWITLGIIGAVLIVGIVALAALGDSASETIEDVLPSALEANYDTQGLTVDVKAADCDDVDFEDGPFEVSCTLTLAETSRTLPATVRGTIDGNTINVTSAESESNLVNEKLAMAGVQQLVDQVADGVEVLSCDLPEKVLVMRKGDTFTCEVDSDETVEITATSGRKIEITSVR